MCRQEDGDRLADAAGGQAPLAGCGRPDRSGGVADEVGETGRAVSECLAGDAGDGGKLAEGVSGRGQELAVLPAIITIPDFGTEPARQEGEERGSGDVVGGGDPPRGRTTASSRMCARLPQSRGSGTLRS